MSVSLLFVAAALLVRAYQQHFSGSLCTGVQVLCTPALANTGNFTVSPQESEEEQYFVTVPQDLSSADGGKLPAT